MFNNTKVNLRDLVCYLVIFVLIGFLAFHSRYSFCQCDESLYPSLCHRLFIGESLFSDEWHPSQVYIPLIYPFYWLYKIIIPSGEGVLLYFRIIYLILSGATALFLFHYMKRNHGYFPAISGVLIVLLYSRANIHGCSYYNICFLSMISAMLCFFQTDHIALYSFFGGVFLSAAVICNPYLSVPIFMIWLSVLTGSKDAKRKKAFYALGGILLCAGFYVIFIFRRTSFSSFCTNILYVLKDEEHQITLLDKFRIFHRQWNEVIGHYATIFVLSEYLIIGIYFFHKNNSKTENWFLVIQLLLPVCSLVMFKSMYTLSRNICYSVSFPFCVIIFPFFLIKVFRTRKTDAMSLIYLLGIITAVSFGFASDTGMDAMTVGFAMSSIGGIAIIKDFIESEISFERYKLIAENECILFAVIMLLIPFFCHRIFGIYRDAPLYRLNYPISEGPAAGLLTTKEHKNEYDEIYQTIKTVNDRFPEGEVVFCKILPWAYTCTNWHYGSPTGWANDLSKEKYLDAYYELHPDKTPDLIFVAEPFVAGVETVLFNNHGACNTFNHFKKEGYYVENWLKTKNIIMENQYIKVYKVSEK